MFGKKETVETQVKPMKSGTATVISQTTKIFGDIETDSEITIEGSLVGDLKNMKGDSSIRISEQGYVEGSIIGTKVIINGVVKGNIVAKNIVECGSSARVLGNIEYNNIQLALGAEVTGNLIRSAGDHHEESYDSNEDDSTDLYENFESTEDY